MNIRSIKLFLAAVGLVMAASAQAVVATPYSALYVFGDSLSDNGNATAGNFIDATQVIQANPPFVPVANMYVPSKTYASGVFSNGPVWATQFATMIGVGLTPSLLGGTDYAVGGAKTSGGDFPLNGQVSAFIGALGANPAPSSALYVIAGGGNNARDTFQALATQADFGVIGSTASAAAAQYANDVGNMVDQLQAKGAQNIIVWNTPNIGLAPALRSIPLTASGLTGSQLGSLISGSLNGALATRLAGETGVLTFDLYGLVGQASANGFTNTTDACGAPSNAGVCADISKAIFWDGIHPTTAAHGFIAQQMFALAVPEPSEIAMLLVGLLVVVGTARRKAA
jgi:outer membrane lipase/esterase